MAETKTATMMTNNPTTDPVMVQVINCASLNVRTQPDIHSEIICSAVKGEKLMLESDGTTDQWAHIYNDYGIEGYVVRDYIKEL